MNYNIDNAVESFKKVLISQLERVEKIKSQSDFTNYSKLDKIIIGVCGGDESVLLLLQKLKEF